MRKEGGRREEGGRKVREEGGRKEGREACGKTGNTSSRGCLMPQKVKWASCGHVTSSG